MSESEQWDKLAGSYDRSVRLFSRSYPRVRELLRRDLEGRGRVLEVAAGTGQFTLQIHLHTVEVTGSNPVTPTTVSCPRQAIPNQILS